LQRKYNHAKRIIAELKRHEQFLAVQLQERDHEYHEHLRLLRERVTQLERELATTQKFAGMPVQLPYSSGQAPVSKDFSPPELVKKPPVFPKQLSEEAEISEAEETSSVMDDEADVSLSLDAAVPFHELLDVSVSKQKAEVTARGSAMAARQRPSIESLKRAASQADDVRRSASGSSAVDSGVMDASSREETPESDGNGGQVSVGVGAVVVTTNQSSKVFQQQSTSPPSMPGRVPNLRPTAQDNPLLQEMRMRQQHQQQQQQQGRPQVFQSSPSSAVAPYVNVPPYGVAESQQQQQPAYMNVHQHHPAADTLADQLKRGLEERRRGSRDNGAPVAGVDRLLAANMEQAVRVANETGEYDLMHVIKDAMHCVPHKASIP